MSNHQTMSKKTKPLFRGLVAIAVIGMGSIATVGVKAADPPGQLIGGSAVALHLGHLWYRYLLLPSQTLTAESGLIETHSPGVARGALRSAFGTACRRSMPDGTSAGISPRAASAGWLRSHVAAY